MAAQLMAAKARSKTTNRPTASRAARRRHTHYAVLGVPANATAAEVRRAYLALIKLHHPDISGADGPSDVARSINQAYRALSDPTRRATYDATLGTTRTVTLRSLPVVTPPPRRRTRWGSRLAAVCLLGAAGCYLVYARQSPASEPRALVAAAAPAERPDQVAAQSHRAAIVQQAGLNFEWVALQSDAAVAERYSRQCWESLLGSGSDSLFDYCLAFDAVAERTYGRERGYFATPALMKRARMIGRGIATGESIKQRISHVGVLLARERPSGRGLPPPISWFPVPGNSDPGTTAPQAAMPAPN